MLFNIKVKNKDGELEHYRPIPTTRNEQDDTFDYSEQARIVEGGFFSANFVPGVTGWQIDGASDSAEFNNVTVRGTIFATTGELENLTVIGQLEIGQDGQIVATDGPNSTIMDSAGIRGISNQLGVTFDLPADGSAPVFANGVIKEVEFQMYTSGVIRTGDAALIGGAEGDAGIVINATGFYAGEQGQDTTNANVRILANGNAFFAGVIQAQSGTFAGDLIGTEMELSGSLKITTPESGTSGILVGRLDTNATTPFHYGFEVDQNNYWKKVVIDASNPPIEEIRFRVGGTEGINFTQTLGGSPATINIGTNTTFQGNITGTGMGFTGSIIGSPEAAIRIGNLGTSGITSRMLNNAFEVGQSSSIELGSGVSEFFVAYSKLTHQFLQVGQKSDGILTFPNLQIDVSGSVGTFRWGRGDTPSGLVIVDSNVSGESSLTTVYPTIINDTLTLDDAIISDLVVKPNGTTARLTVTNGSTTVTTSQTDFTGNTIRIPRVTSTSEGFMPKENGMIWYNIDTNKFRGYQNGVGVDLIFEP